MTPTRYPLAWPVGWKRTPPGSRTSGRFASRRNHALGRLEDVTIAGSCERLLGELQRMGIPEHAIVISTDLQLRLDGIPRSGQPAPKDPGAAVYWKDSGQDRCMAIDRYSKVEQNIAALAATIDAMRAIERHGGAAILDRAFTGFTALPAPIVVGMKRPWREVLGLPPGLPYDAADVSHRYRQLAALHHPDRGGNPTRMAEINAARDEALKELQHG